MMQSLQNAWLFLINVAFDLYILVILLRILLPWLGANFYNPISQLVTTLTNPLINPLRNAISGKAASFIAAISLLIIIDLVKFTLLLWFATDSAVSMTRLIPLIIGDLTSKLINIFFYAVIIHIIWSWINPHAYNPLREIVSLIAERVLAPVRRYLPPVNGFDLSPIVVITGLFTVIVFIQSLLHM